MASQDRSGIVRPNVVDLVVCVIGLGLAVGFPLSQGAAISSIWPTAVAAIVVGALVMCLPARYWALASFGALVVGAVVAGRSDWALAGGWAGGLFVGLTVGRALRYLQQRGQRQPGRADR